MGRAPFQFERYERKPGETCAFCGRSIANLYFVRSEDGRSSPVGSQCVFKTSDLELHRAVRDQIRAMRKTTEAEQIDWAEDLIAQPDVQAALSRSPAPDPWRAQQGDTAGDWCRWMMAHSEKTGKLKVARFLQDYDFDEG